MVANDIKKTAERSNITSTAQQLLSNAVAMSWCTLKSAESVEWYERFADCKLSWKKLESKLSSIFFATTFPTIFDTKWRFETGRLFLKTSLSKPDFFNSGLTIACLKSEVTTASHSDLLTIVVKTGTKESVHCFSRTIGTGSSSHDLDCELMSSFLTSSKDAAVKSVRGWTLNLCSQNICFHVTCWVCILKQRSDRLNIDFPTKNAANLLDSSVLQSSSGRDGSWFLSRRRFVRLYNRFDHFHVQ